MSHLGTHLRELRMAAGLTQADLASALRRHGASWDKSTVSRVEHGKRSLSAGELGAIALELDLDLAEAAALTANARRDLVSTEEAA